MCCVVMVHLCLGDHCILLLFCKDYVSLGRIAFGVIANNCSLGGPLKVAYLDRETVLRYLNCAALLVYVILMLACCMA